MPPNLIMLITVSICLLAIILYKVYVLLFIPSIQQIRATTNEFNNINHKSDFDKSMSYHTLDA
jgi:hypothetical protein